MTETASVPQARCPGAQWSNVARGRPAWQSNRRPGRPGPERSARARPWPGLPGADARHNPQHRLRLLGESARVESSAVPLPDAGVVSDGPVMRTTSTVILSWPPRRFAKSVNTWADSEGGKLARIGPISSSWTRPVSPSLQSRNVSPSSSGKGPSKSVCTVGLGPSERVMMFLGTTLAKLEFGSNWPCSRNSHTRLWSNVSCSRILPRMRYTRLSPTCATSALEEAAPTRWSSSPYCGSPRLACPR